MIDVTELIKTGGLLILFLIIFSESGMMVGFVFPGDTLLLSAGVLAASGHLPIFWTILVITLAAILGDNTGYQIGKRFGPKVFKKDGLVFRHDHIVRAEKFFEKYGIKLMLVAHFIPIVRSFAPVVAGAGKMDYRKFFIFDAIGVIAWSVSITLLGYFVASKIPGIEHYIEPVLLAIIAIFLLPTIWHIVSDRRIRAAVKAKFKKTPPDTKK